MYVRVPTRWLTLDADVAFARPDILALDAIVAAAQARNRGIVRRAELRAGRHDAAVSGAHRHRQHLRRGVNEHHLGSLACPAAREGDAGRAGLWIPDVPLLRLLRCHANLLSRSCALARGACLMLFPAGALR